jgi:hypothetical protein
MFTSAEEPHDLRSIRLLTGFGLIALVFLMILTILNALFGIYLDTASLIVASLGFTVYACGDVIRGLCMS